MVQSEDYLLRHLAEHLYAAERFADLHRLITRDWMVRKRARLGSNQSFSHDLELAITGGQPATITEMPRFFQHCLLSKTIGVISGNAPPQRLQLLAATGRVDEALAIADDIDTQRRQAWALHHIALAVSSWGQAAAAIPIWSRARTLAASPAQLAENATEQEAPGRLAAAIAACVAESGFTHEAQSALATARQQLPKPPEKDTEKAKKRWWWVSAASGWADVARAEQRLGHNRQRLHASLESAWSCLLTADSELYPYVYAGMSALREIAARSVEAGDRVVMREIWDVIQPNAFRLGEKPPAIAWHFDADHRIAAYAQGAAEAGQKDFAMSALRHVRQLSPHRPGMRASSRKTALSPAFDLCRRVDAAAALALAVAMRRRDGARGRSLLPPLPQPESFLRYVAHYFSEPTIDEALATLDDLLDQLHEAELAENKTSLKNSWRHNWALKIARAGSRIGIPGVAALADSLKSNETFKRNHAGAQTNRNAVTRSIALATAALAEVLNNQHVEGVHRMHLAIENAAGLVFDREETDGMIAELQLKAGLIDKPGVSSERTEHEGEFEELYADMAVALARAGRDRSASEALREARRGAGDELTDLVTQAAPKIATACWRAGMEQLAAEVVSQIDEPEGLALLAGGLVRVGSHKEARRLIGLASGRLIPILSLEQEPVVLAMIAEAWADMGEIKRARRSVRRAWSAIQVLAGERLTGSLLSRLLTRLTGEKGQFLAPPSDLLIDCGFVAHASARCGDADTLGDITRFFDDLPAPIDPVKMAVEVVEAVAAGSLYADEAVAPDGLYTDAAVRATLRAVLTKAASLTAGLDSGNGVDLLVRIARQQGVIGDSEGLHATAALLSGQFSESPPGTAVAVLAPAFASLGDANAISTACALIASIDDADLRKALLPSVVTGLVGVLKTAAGSNKLLESVLQTSHVTTPSAESASALANLAQAVAKRSDAPELAASALEVARNHAKAVQFENPECLAMAAMAFASASRPDDACPLLADGANVARRLHAGGVLASSGRRRILDYISTALPVYINLDPSGVAIEELWTRVHDAETWWSGPS